LPENLVALGPAARITLNNKIRNLSTDEISSGAADAFLIVLDGISEQQQEQFTIPQSAAIRRRMRTLGLPR
jgi:hypothetical protein